MTRNEHVLAEEERMTAARPKQREGEKLTGVRTEKKKKKSKQGKKNKKPESRTQGVDNNKASRLCCKAEPGTRSAIFLLTLVTSGSKCEYCAVEPPLP